MCEANHAFDDVIWEGQDLTSVYACDMGFGGDRASSQLRNFWPGHQRPAKSSCNARCPTISQSTSAWTRRSRSRSTSPGTPTTRAYPGRTFFYDAGVRATAAVAMSKLVSQDCNAVNFGGNPTKRPVSANECVINRPRNTGQSGSSAVTSNTVLKFVTEMAFAVRLLVLSGQLRGLPREVADEFTCGNGPGERRQIRAGNLK